MTKRFFYIIFIISSALATACIEDDVPSNSNQIEVGDTIPYFSVYTSDSICINRDSLVGHRSLIAFFNTSCADCRDELPCIDSLYRAMDSISDFRLICIARNEETESIERFWNDNGLIMPYAPQSDREVYNLFAQSIIPRIYICSADGVIRFTYGDSYMPPFAALYKNINSL